MLVAISFLQSFNCDVQVFNDYRLVEDEFRDVPARFGGALPIEGLHGRLMISKPEDACKLPQPAPANATKWVLIVARYNCKFADKVRNAQKMGYDAVIVYNVNSSALEVMSANNADDIIIPSVFVSDDTGECLKQYPYYDGYYVVINGDLPFNINTNLLLPFAIVVGLCLIIMIVFMIVKCIKDRRRAQRHRLPCGMLKKIPVCKFAKGDPYEMCAICLDDYLEGEKLRVLPCAHAYHCKCIDPWLTRNKRVCPVCKRRVLAPGETRRRAASSDSDTDDSQTPLVSPVAGVPRVTQGGTFVERTVVDRSTFLNLLRHSMVARNANVEAPARPVPVRGQECTHDGERNNAEQCSECYSRGRTNRRRNSDPYCGPDSGRWPRTEKKKKRLQKTRRANNIPDDSSETEDPNVSQPTTIEVCRSFVEQERQTQSDKQSSSKHSKKAKGKNRPKSSKNNTPSSSSDTKIQQSDSPRVSPSHSINDGNVEMGNSDKTIGGAALPNTEVVGTSQGSKSAKDLIAL